MFSQNLKTTSLLIFGALSIFATSCGDDDDKDKPADPIMMEDPEPVTKVSWNYDDKGPAKWGALSPDFILCAEGLKQSPIDLPLASIVNKGDATALTFEYKEDAVLKAINNTHTNEFGVDEGSFVTFNGKKFQLAQFHGHAKSEHQINGEQSPLELHFVHVSEDNELLVVGVLIDEGDENVNYTSFWTEENFLETAAEKVDQSVEGTHDLTKLFPQNSSLYQYDGSLTTPPCSEGVNWNVLTQKITMSADQLALFTNIFDNNYRPVQSLNEREIISTEEDDTVVVNAVNL